MCLLLWKWRTSAQGMDRSRWSAYLAFIALAVLAPFILFKHRTAAISKDARKFPIPGCLTADVAAAAWRLAPWRKGILSAPL